MPMEEGREMKLLLPEWCLGTGSQLHTDIRDEGTQPLLKAKGSNVWTLGRTELTFLGTQEVGLVASLILFEDNWEQQDWWERHKGSGSEEYSAGRRAYWRALTTEWTKDEEVERRDQAMAEERSLGLEQESAEGCLVAFPVGVKRMDLNSDCPETIPSFSLRSCIVPGYSPHS